MMSLKQSTSSVVVPASHRRGNFKRPNNGNGNKSNSNGNNNGNVSCRYCKRKATCKSRRCNNPPMVNTNRKQFTRNNVDKSQTGIESVMLT